MVWARLRWWWRKGRPVRDVVMYTRRGCHLCDDAWALLEQARRRHGFALRQVDVDGDPELVRQYGLCVPVVVIDGRVRFRGVVNRVLLARLLSADEEPKVLEGTWNRDKLVLMSSPDETAFQAWASSPEYLDIAKDRKAGADAVVLLAKGFSP